MALDPVTDVGLSPIEMKYNPIQRRVPSSPPQHSPWYFSKCPPSLPNTHGVCHPIDSKYNTTASQEAKSCSVLFFSHNAYLGQVSVWVVKLYVNGFCPELFVQRSEFNSA